jgi:hypothetical protein
VEPASPTRVWASRVIDGAARSLRGSRADRVSPTARTPRRADPEAPHSPRPDPADRYGAHATVADLLRQIEHDERMHKEESERHLAERRLG